MIFDIFFIFLVFRDRPVLWLQKEKHIIQCSRGRLYWVLSRLREDCFGLECIRVTTAHASSSRTHVRGLWIFDPGIITEACHLYSNSLFLDCTREIQDTRELWCGVGACRWLLCIAVLLELFVPLALTIDIHNSERMYVAREGEVKGFMYCLCFVGMTQVPGAKSPVSCIFYAIPVLANQAPFLTTTR